MIYWDKKYSIYISHTSFKFLSLLCPILLLELRWTAGTLLHLDDLKLRTVLLVSKHNHVRIIIMGYSIFLRLFFNWLNFHLRDQFFLESHTDFFELLIVDHPDHANILRGVLVGKNQVNFIGFAYLKDGLGQE
jgi:hypothetical protein